jgi:hypothetical protein
VFTFFGTTIVEFFFALIALDEEQMTAIVFAVGVVVARLATLMAMGNHFV